MWDNEAESSDELSFWENDIIRILSQDPSGWWKGEANGRIGFFPGNRVSLLR
jgi:myosin-1